jgi:hypothetical protein
MRVSHDDAMTTDVPTAAVAPRSVILHVGDHHCEALLTAATEGATRFVTSAPGEPGGRSDSIASALHLLSNQSGYVLTPDDIEAVLLRGRPLRVRLVGEAGDDDRAVLRSLARDGTLHVANPHETPPHGGSRRADWVRQGAEQFNRGAYDVLIVALPSGDVPDWAAQLVTAVQESSLRTDRHLIVLSPGAAIAPALLPGAMVLERDDALRQSLADRLTHIRATRLIPSLPAPMRTLSSTTAIAAGVSFARDGFDETIVYLDISEGSTAVIAHPAGVELLHDAACDLASGAVTLLHRLGAEEVARWIPFPIEAAALQGWAVRRVAAPRAILIDPVDRAIAGGFARAALRALIATAATSPAPTRCIVGPGIVSIGLPTDLLLVVADILPTSRIVAVEADADDLLPVVGYSATQSTTGARSLLVHDALAPLGTVMTVPSRGERNVSTVAAILTGSNNSTRTAIAQDDVTLVALYSAGTVRAIGRDGREEPVTVHGGSGGLLVDTRARPLRGVATRAEARGNVSNRLRAALAGEEMHRE